jgi:hypothetical protein
MQPAAGDLIDIILKTSTTTGTLTVPPSGFTQKNTVTNSLVYVEWFTISNGASGETFTYPMGGTPNGRCDTWVIDVSGENQSAPFDINNVNASTLTGSAGPFITNAVTASNPDDFAIAAVDAGTTGLTLTGFAPSGATNWGDSGDFSNHLFTQADVPNGAGTYSVQWSASSTNSFAHQLEVLDMIAPASSGGSAAGPDLAQPVCHSVGSSSCTMMSAPADGDVLIAVVENAGASNMGNCASGWTLRSSASPSSSTIAANTCTQVASSVTTTVTPDDGTGHTTTNDITVYDVTGTGLAIDASSGAISGTGSQNLAIAPTQANDLILSAAFAGGSGTTQLQTPKTPNGLGWYRVAESSAAPVADTFFDGAAYLMQAASGSQAVGWGFTGSSASPLVVAIAISGSTTATSYAYQGCKVFGNNDLVVDRNLSTASIDPNSATIISQLPGGSFDTGDDAPDEQMNVGTSATNLEVVGTNGGHNPPMNNGSGATIPWINCTTSCNGNGGGTGFGGTGGFIESLSDAHAHVITTDTCDLWETFGSKSTSTTFAASAGFHAHLNNNYYTQPTNVNFAGKLIYDDAGQVSGMPMTGVIDWGEDASLPAINHPLSLIVPGGTGLSADGYVFPATCQGACAVADTGCGGSACTHPLHMGDLIRLAPSFSCGSYTTIGQLVCNQLKNYGAYITDTGSSYELRFGLSAAGIDTWNYTTNLKPLFSALSISVFQIVKEPTIQCASGTFGSTCF